MYIRLQSIVFAASALLVTATPADPTITPAALLPRQNADNFIGYLKVNDSYSSVDCDPNLTWYQSGQYAQCCPETLSHCYAATACVGGSQIYTYPDLSSKTTIACTDNYNNTALSICNTIFIYENTLDSNPRTNINCGDSRSNWSYYRSLPASSTEEVASSPTSSLPSVSNTAPNASIQTSEPESGSKAWIAGAVAGPILGLALIGAGVWLCLRRKKKTTQMAQHGAAFVTPVDPSQPPVGVGGYTEAKPHFQPAQPTYYNPSAQPGLYNQQYSQQGGFSPPQQGGFSPPQMSPAPQYGFQPVYNATSSPPPGAHAQDVKYEATGEAAELGGNSNPIAPVAPAASSIPNSPQPYTAQTAQVAELSGSDATSGHPSRPQ